MTMYIEYVIIDNFIVSFLSLYLSSVITKTEIKKINFTLSLIISVVFAVCLPFIKVEDYIIILLKILVWLLICIIALNNIDLKRKIFIFPFSFFTLNLIIFALLSVIVKLFGGTSNLSVYYLDLPASIVLFILFLYFKVLINFISKLNNSYKIEEYIYQVEFKFRSKKIKINAFLDSGNSLYDEKYNLPVAVIPFKLANKILNKNELLCLVLRKQIETIEGMHYIEYSTASSKSCKMPIFKLDKLKIKGKNFEDEIECMLGISYSVITKSGNYDMLLGLSMIKC